MAKSINIPCLQPFIIESNTSSNLDKLWIRWREDLVLFLMASAITSDDQKKALLLHLGGSDIKEIYRGIQQMGDKYKDTIIRLDEYFKPRKNITYERYLFKQTKLNKNENSSNYITRLRRLAETCEFDDTNIEIRDQFIVHCVSSSLKKKLLREGEFSLEKLLEIVRNEEAASERLVEINKTEESEEKIHKLTKYQPTNSSSNYRGNNRRYNDNGISKSQNCTHCGNLFVTGHLKQCRAIGKTCYNCGGKNHFSSVCFVKQTQPRKQQKQRDSYKVLHIEKTDTQTSTSEEEILFTLKNNEINGIVVNKFKCQNITIEGVNVSMVIDSGSTTNVIDNSTFKNINKEKNPKIQLKKTVSKLYPYASKPLQVIGYFNALLETEQYVCAEKIFVVDHENAGNLLGLKSAETLKLVAIDVNSICHQESSKFGDTVQTELSIIPKELKPLIGKYDNIFKGHGKLLNYECKLYIDKTVKSVYQKMRKHPYYVRKKIDQELSSRLEQADIIESVSGPQEWASNLVATPKKDGSVRLCLDSRMINTAIKRETHPIPTVESIIDDLHGAKIFFFFFFFLQSLLKYDINYILKMRQIQVYLLTIKINK